MKELLKKISEQYKEGMALYAASAEPVHWVNRASAINQFSKK